MKNVFKPSFLLKQSRFLRTNIQGPLYQALIIEKGKSRYPISFTLHNLLDIASARDIFQLQLTPADQTLQYESSDSSFILAREKQIVLSIGCIKAILSNNKIILLDYHLPIVKDWATEFDSEKSHDNLQLSTDNAFYLHCLEEILIYQCDLFERRMRLINPLVVDLCSTNMRTQTNVDGNPRLQKVMTLQDSLSSFSDQLRHTKDAIVEVLKTPDDMHSIIAMDEGENPVQKIAFDLERILECYASLLTRMIQINNYNIGKLERRQAAAIFYDSARRTKIVQLNLNLSLATLTISFLGGMAGLFGMNLNNGLENSPYLFFPIAGGIVMGALGVHTILKFNVSSALENADLEKHAQSMAAIQKVMRDRESLDLAIKKTFKLLEDDEHHPSTSPQLFSTSHPSITGINPILSPTHAHASTLSQAPLNSEETGSFIPPLSTTSSPTSQSPPTRRGISKEEFTRLVLTSQRRKGTLTPGNINAFFDLIDTDKDGFIERNEIVHLKL